MQKQKKNKKKPTDNATVDVTLNAFYGYPI